MSNESRCPFFSGQPAPRARTNRDWWPNQLNLGVLRQLSASNVAAHTQSQLEIILVRQDLLE